MNESIQENVPNISLPPLFMTSFWKRFLYGGFVVVMPFVDFAFIKLLKPDWQSGRFQDYINLFLSPEAALLFFPLLAYSLVCFVLLLANAEKYAGSFVIRFGIYTGVFLALQYGVLTALALDGSTLPAFLLIALAYISPFIIKKIYQWLAKIWPPVLIRNFAIGGGILILLTLMIIQHDNILSPFFTLLLLLGAVAPFWSFLISGQVALWLFKTHESKLTVMRGIGLVTWLAAYAYALRFDLLKMYELYAVLPPQPPDCYIATAAAKGHPRIVGSQLVRLKNGNHMQVNSQLQRLKAVELALIVVTPKLHQWIRKIYDVAGKRLATHIQNPLLADVAFLLLTPVEWVSFVILKIIIPEIEVLSKKIYSL